MAHRNGGKFKTTHTTYCELAVKIVDIAVRFQAVTGISPGMLQSGKGVSSGGGQRVKFGDMVGGLCLTVRQSRSVQELRIYCTDVQATRLALARALRDQDIPVAFRH